MKQRIAYIGIKGLPSKAGADRVVEAIVRGLDKHQYEPTVYCSRRVVPSSIEIPGIRLIRVPSVAGKHMHALSLFVISTLHCLLFGRYDVVHIHNVEACFVLPLLRLRFKVIATSHGVTQRRDKWSRSAKLLISMAEYPFIFFADVSTSVSRPLALEYTKKYGRQVRYLPNGVDVEESVDFVSAERMLGEHGLVPGEYILFVAGRIIATKGCHLLLQALNASGIERPIVIVGDLSHVPDYARQLNAMASEQVHFIPFVDSKATLMGLVQHARLFVFPSTVEAMSMMLLEAVSIGAPVLYSDIPENTAILPENTLSFKSGDVDDLREKLQWALTNADQMILQADSARAWVLSQYNWSNIIKEYESLYAEVLRPTGWKSKQSLKPG